MKNGIKMIPKDMNMKQQQWDVGQEYLKTDMEKKHQLEEETYHSQQ